VAGTRLFGQPLSATQVNRCLWMDKCARFGLLLIFPSVALSLAPYQSAADETDVEVIQKYTPTGRHRLDLSYTRYDTFAGEVDMFLPSYTWAPWQNLRFSITGSVVANDSGDADQRLSADTWFASPGAGWAIDSIDHLWLIPATGYEFTFNEGAYAAPVNEPYVSMDFIWVFDSGAWFSVTPKPGYEFEAEEWIDQYLVTIGKM
jgi:hypothetical protein